MKYGIIHCSDTPIGMDVGVEEITRWHTDKPPRGNGWSAIGYALVIKRDGSVEKGRDRDNDGDVFNEIGAHARGFNRDGFGICLVGGKSKFNFTDQQMVSLWFEMDEIEKRFPDIEWMGHCDIPGVTKECPMFDVRSWRGI
jgi:N-acetylmuramoyl-L-alanine amidase